MPFVRGLSSQTRIKRRLRLTTSTTTVTVVCGQVRNPARTTSWIANTQTIAKSARHANTRRGCVNPLTVVRGRFDLSGDGRRQALKML